MYAQTAKAQRRMEWKERSCDCAPVSSTIGSALTYIMTHLTQQRKRTLSMFKALFLKESLDSDILNRLLVEVGLTWNTEERVRERKGQRRSMRNDSTNNS